MTRAQLRAEYPGQAQGRHGRKGQTRLDPTRFGCLCISFSILTVENRRCMYPGSGASPTRKLHEPSGKTCHALDYYRDTVSSRRERKVAARGLSFPSRMLVEKVEKGTSVRRAVPLSEQDGVRAALWRRGSDTTFFSCTLYCVLRKRQMN